MFMGRNSGTICGVSGQVTVLREVSVPKTTGEIRDMTHRRANLKANERKITVGRCSGTQHIT